MNSLRWAFTSACATTAVAPTATRASTRKGRIMSYPLLLIVVRNPEQHRRIAIIPGLKKPPKRRSLSISNRFSLRRIGGPAGCSRPGQAIREAAAHHIKGWRKDQPEGRHSDHAEEHGGAERLAHFRARARSPDQRRDAEDKGQRGHNDRAQAQPRRLVRGLDPIMPAIFQLPREFDD